MSKRILSLVLAMVMVLGTFGTVFAADTVTTEAEAGAFLKSVGVLKGYEDGSLGLDNNFARQEAVILVAQLRGEIEDALNFSKLPTYEDVKIKFYNAPLAWAQDNGLFVGHSDKVFGFGENLTAQQYSRVLFEALGYKVDTTDASDIKYSVVFDKADEEGILKGLELAPTTEITRGQMSLMTYNALGLKVKGSNKTLAETLGIEMPVVKEDKLTAKVLDTENLAEIVVELSNADLVKNKEALTNPANYRLNDDNVQVHNVDLDGDNVILTLVPYGRLDEIAEDLEDGNIKNGVLLKGKKYELTIRNIDREINTTYKGIEAKDNTIPSVEKVEFIGTHGIKVTTNEPINNLEERNFRISDKRTSMFVEQYGREIILTPYHKAEFDKDATELVVEELRDFANYRSAKTVEKMELDKDTTKPEVVEAYRSGSKLTLVFDQDIYHESINYNESRRELGNVSFVERRATFYAETAKKIDTNVAVYTFEREIPKNAEVLVEGVQNHSKETMEKETVVPELYNDEYAPVVISSLDTTVATTGTEVKGDVLKTSTKGLTIKFDKDIKEFAQYLDDKKAIDPKDFFELYELEVSTRNEITDKVEIEIVEVKKDSIKIDFENKDTNERLKINNNKRDFDYVLEVRNFSDLSGNRMVREYIDFYFVEKDAGFTVEVGVPYHRLSFNRNTIEIPLKFSKVVNKDAASNAKNYFLDGKVKVAEAIVERDGKTVTLVVNDFKTVEAFLKDYRMLEISPAVIDLDDNIVSPRFFNLLTQKPITDLVTDADNAKKAADLLAKLPEELKVEDIKAIEEAIAKFEEVQDETLLSKEAKELYAKAKDTVEVLKVEKALAELPEELKVEDIDAIKAIEEQFGKLTAEQVDKLSEEVKDLYTEIVEVKLPALEAEKAENEAKEEALKEAIKLATEAVEKAEKSKKAEDVEEAEKLVKALPAGEAKTNLLVRLAEIVVEDAE